MTQQIINIGSAANDGSGDPLRTSFVKANANFTELYAYAAPLDALAYNGMQINGSMEVSQERGGSGLTANSGYIIDGWVIANTSGATITSIQNSTFLGGFTKLLAVVVGTGAGSIPAGGYCDIVQAIEGYRIARLSWGTANAQPVTIGFWTAHHRTGLYTGVIRNPAANRSYAFSYTQNASDNFEYKIVTIPGCTDGVWPVDNGTGMSVMFAMAGGTTFTAPSLGGWLAGNYLAGSGQVNAVAASTDLFIITGVVVLPGIEAPAAARSPFIMRPYDQELVMCQRYYEKINQVWMRSDAATGTHYSWIPTSMIMRSSPTVSLANTTFGASSAALISHQSVNGGEVAFTVSALNGFITTDVIFDARL